jgi:hypothetical protein
LSQQSTVTASAGQESPIQQVHQGVVALVAHLMEEPRVDLRHRLSFVNETYEINGDDGLYVWTLEGHCIANAPSHDLIVKLSGDSPISGTVEIVVKDLESGKQLDYMVLVDRTHSKVVSIFFDQPLQQNDRFSIQVTCRWPGTFPRSRRSDYIFLGWGTYASAGVSRMKGRLSSDRFMSNGRIELLVDGEWVTAPWQPTSTAHLNGSYVIEWDIPDPTHLYLVSFDREQVERGSSGV